MPLSLLDRFWAPAPAPGRADWLAEHSYAHRGLHGPGVVENSLSAFALALEAGIGIECDVRASLDGHAMVFHDAALDRLTEESGPVAARNVGELTHIRLAGSPDRIPTLRDLLRRLAGAVPLLVEVKSRPEMRVSPLCLAIRRDLEGYGGPVAVMSFDPRVGRWFARHAPHILRGLVVSEENARTFSGRIRRHQALWWARAEFLAYDVRDLPSRFAAAQRRRGLPILTWTVRSRETQEIAARFADAAIAEGAGLS